MSDWWNQPNRSAGQPESAAAPGAAPAPICPWCGAPATAADAEICPSCGASLSQREDLKGLAIPGVTVVDPELLRKRAARTPGGDPTRAVAMRMGGSVGGVVGSLAVGAAFLAAEKLSARGDTPPNPEDIGKPGETAMTLEARVSDLDRALAPQVEPAAPVEPGDASEPIDWSI